MGGGSLILGLELHILFLGIAPCGSLLRWVLCFCVNSLFLFKSGSPEHEFKMLSLTAVSWHGKMDRGNSCLQWDFCGGSFRVAGPRRALVGQSVRVFCVLRLPSQFRSLLVTIAVPCCGCRSGEGTGKWKRYYVVWVYFFLFYIYILYSFYYI